MKKKVLALILALVLALSGAVVCTAPGMQVYAEEEEGS